MPGYHKGKKKPMSKIKPKPKKGKKVMPEMDDLRFRGVLQHEIQSAVNYYDSVSFPKSVVIY